MARYQLFRTSPLLSGQVRLDLLVNKDPETQVITADELHLSPLNPQIIYNESDGRNLMRYSHLENLKDLYRQIRGQFYDTSGEYLDNIWIYDSKGHPVDPYSHIYMMGPQRMRYSRYQKQFSWLAPLWISEQTDFSKIRFLCHMSGESERDVILSSFKLSPEICKYLQDYMDHSSTGDPVSENLVEVDFDLNSSYIQGVQVDAGQYMTRDTSYINEFLLKRERPMMETDYNILDLFSQNHMVAQQLLNLNLVFNLRDISGTWPEYYLYNKKIKFWIDVQYEDRSLELKDLYTNYEFIPKYDLSYMRPSSENCLDFMSDYMCVDTITNNKFTQPVFHWALSRDPEYMFNLYSGCSPKVGSDMVLEGGNFDWVDVSLMNLDPWQQNWKWAKCNKVFGDFWEDMYNDAIDENNQKMINNLFTKINKTHDTISIGNNIFYKYKDDSDRQRYQDLLKDWENVQNTYITIVIDSNLDDDYEIRDLTPTKSGPEGPIYIMILCKDEESAVMYTLCKNLREKYLNDSSILVGRDVVKNFLLYFLGCDNSRRGLAYNMRDRWVRPSKIEFTESLDKYNIDLELLNQKTKEIQYAESQDSYYSYMYRYTGKLVPFFIDVDDTFYINDYYRYFQWTDADTDIIRRYSEVLNLKMKLLYPSIEIWDGVKCFPWEKNNHDEGLGFYKDWSTDIFWDRNSEVWNLPPQLSFEITLPRTLSDSEIKKKIWYGFKNALLDMSNSQDCPLYDVIMQNEVWMRDYIENLYEIEQQFEYEKIDDISNIIYTVTYKLR